MAQSTGCCPQLLLHTFIFISSIPLSFFAFFPSPLGLEGVGVARIWENTATEIGLWRWTLPRGGRKPLRCHHQGLCKQNAEFSPLSFFLPSLVGGKAWFSVTNLVRIQRTWPLYWKNDIVRATYSEKVKLDGGPQKALRPPYQGSLNPALQICLGRWYLLGSALWGH